MVANINEICFDISFFKLFEGGISVAGQSERNAGVAVSIKTRVKLYKTYFKNSL